MVSNIILFSKVLESISPFVLIKQNGKILYSNMPREVNTDMEEINYEGSSFLKNEKSFSVGGDNYEVVSYADVTSLKSKANYDAKTKILSFETFKTLVDDIIAEHDDFVFGILDIDDFKHFNDCYGHAIGDEVLIAVARKIKHSIKEEDLVGRFGGDEFLVVVKNIDIKTAEERANEILRNLQAGFTFKNNLSLPITLSVGLAPYDYSKSYDQNFNTIDGLLYRSKQNGKNQISVPGFEKKVI